MEGANAHDLNSEPRTNDVAAGQIKSFKEFNLRFDIIGGLNYHRFVTPTKIQAAAIPMALTGMDLLVQSKSGTGKSLIFVLTALQLYDKSIYKPQVLIIVPTRELALQIEDTLNGIGRYVKQGHIAVSCIGGTDVAKDRTRLTTGRVVVGTPGRLKHLLLNNFFDTSAIKLLVLDEADELYTDLMLPTVNDIVSQLPAQRQVIACSATYEPEIEARLAKTMHKPLLVSNCERATVLLGIRQFVFELPQQTNSMLEMRMKLQALHTIFAQLPYEQGIIFANSQMRADSYCNYLRRDKVDCELLSGALKQSERHEAFLGYRSFTTRTLIATDLMARGVDSAHANTVINMDLPKDYVTYLHRIGRAGRFGSKGVAVTLLLESQRSLFKKLLADAGTGMSVMQFPSEKVEGLNLWDFDAYEFPYFFKAVAPVETEDALLRVTNPWKKSHAAKTSLTKTEREPQVVAKLPPTSDLNRKNAAATTANSNKETVPNQQLDAVAANENPQKKLELMTELAAWNNMENLQSGNIVHVINIAAALQAQQTVEQFNFVDRAEKSLGVSKSELQSHHDFPTKPAENIDWKSVQPKIHMSAFKEMEEAGQVDVSNSGFQSLQAKQTKLTENLDLKSVQPEVQMSALKQLEEQVATPTVEIQLEEVGASIPNKPAENVALESVPAKVNMSALKQLEEQVSPSTVEIDTKTYCLAEPTECSSTTQQPMIISNTVDDASSIVSDSLENGYASENSKQIKCGNRSAKTAHIFEWLNTAERRKCEGKSSTVSEAELELKQSNETEEPNSISLNMPLAADKQILKSEEIAQHQCVSRIEAEWHDKRSNTMKQLYCTESKPEAERAAASSNSVYSSSREPVHSEPCNTPADWYALKLAAPIGGLSVHVNKQLNILPDELPIGDNNNNNEAAAGMHMAHADVPAAVVVDPVFVVAAGSDHSDWSVSDNTTPSRSYSSSGFIESNESASSGIDTSQYSADSSLTGDSVNVSVNLYQFYSDSEAVDDDNLDGELTETSSWSAGETDDEDNDEDDDVDVASANPVQLYNMAQANWQKIYQDQLQCINSYVASYGHQ